MFGIGLDEVIGYLFSEPFLIFGRIFSPVPDSHEDGGLSESRQPRAKHFYRLAQIPVEVEEREFSIEAGTHGVDDGVALVPQRPDGV